MPRLQNKSNTDIIINVADDAPLPGGADAWEPAGTKHTGRRRSNSTNTGSVPTQGNDN